MRSLENVSDYLATVRGRRKAVLMFSEGIDYPTADLFGSSRVSDVQGALQDVVTAAARADVNYFTIDPRGLVGMDSTFVEMASVSVEDSLSPGGNGAMNVVPEALLAEMRLSLVIMQLSLIRSRAEIQPTITPTSSTRLLARVAISRPPPISATSSMAAGTRSA